MKFMLLVAACLANQPGECRQEYLPLPEITNETACRIGGHVRLREWVNVNQGWKLTDARCLPQKTVTATAADYPSDHLF